MPNFMVNYDKKGNMISDYSRNKSDYLTREKRFVCRINTNEIWVDEYYKYYLLLNKNKKVQIKASFTEKPDGMYIGYLQSYPTNRFRASDFYYNIIKHDKITLWSDNCHSYGGMKTWYDLSRKSDIIFEHRSQNGKKCKLYLGDRFINNYNNDYYSTKFVARLKE